MSLQNNALCGIDEAGRGCVGGSLFVSGVILDENIPPKLLESLKDSKKLTQKKRDCLAPKIKAHSCFFIVEKSAKEIDEIGLSKAIKDSLLEIMGKLKAEIYLFDGNCNYGISSLQTLIKGDSKVPSISAASILSKSAKDSQMEALHEIYPQYNFAKNKGYVTKEHLESIQKYGLCKEHRKSYRLKALQKSLFN